MDKEYLYLRVRTDDSVQQTPNPKENYVLIYPVVQVDEVNNMSIHLKDNLGNMHKVSGSTQKINLLQNQLDTLQGDLISILQEILGYSDISESSSSMSSDVLQPIGFVLTGCDVNDAFDGQYYYTVSDNGTVVSYNKRTEESEMYAKIYYNAYFNDGCWVIVGESDSDVVFYNSSLNSDADIQVVAQFEWQSNIGDVTPPSFERFIYDSMGGG